MKNQHGGKRKGSGAKKKKESEKKKSKVMRIPNDKIKAVESLLLTHPDRTKTEKK